MKYIKTYDRAFNIEMAIVQDGMSPADASAEETMRELLQAVANRKCKTTGIHRWVDESYGNSEHGSIHMHCTRCGFMPTTIFMY